jgi:ADP-ribosyl-[dinitrogen reductase] hydrolase
VGSNPTASSKVKKDIHLMIATLIGCAIGDALGNPFEMKPAASPLLKAWDGLFKAGGTFWKGQPGQYTDDTLMSIALSSSLIENSGFVPEHVAQMYLEWYKSGNTRGIGNTTATAMENLKSGATWEKSGLKNFNNQPAGGNGTAMRAAPIGLFYRNDLEQVLSAAYSDAIITHNATEPKMGSVAVALGTALLANGTHNPSQMLTEVIGVVDPNCHIHTKLRLAQQFVEDGWSAEQALAQIGVSGYVPETVGAAFYCLVATDNFKDAVVMAVRAGGDTDTTAAVVGALAGTYYGLEGIPPEYKDNVENKELLQFLTDELVNNAI